MSALSKPIGNDEKNAVTEDIKGAVNCALKDKIKEEIKKEYRYRIETHSHTKPVSPCSFLPPERLIEIYKENGYDALAVTNHFSMLLCRDRSKEEYCKAYIDDFKRAKAEGEKLGVEVILGAEVRFPDTANDYLVYGIEEKDIYEIFDLLVLDYKSFSEKFRKDGRLFLQAHPFRDGMTQIDYSYVDGIESFNMHVNHNSRVAAGAKLVASKPGFIGLCGSDAHEEASCCGGGIYTRVLPHNSHELAEIIRQDDFLFSIADKLVL